MVTPQVDGENLVALVKRFEEDKGFIPAGGYSGLIPSYLNYGDLRAYFLGHSDTQWPEPEHLWLLGCDCGEVICWPLAARVIAQPATVTWTEFAQTYRSQWDYSGFGPFIFDRKQYERAVTLMAEQVESD
jgi:hypothetical protein